MRSCKACAKHRASVLPDRSAPAFRRQAFAQLRLLGLAQQSFLLLGQQLPDALLLVVDATTLERSLVLVGQALRLGLPTALVLTMVDREEGAAETFAEAGLEFRSLYKAGEFLKA